MKELKAVFKDRTFLRYGIFIVSTVAILYVLYFFIKNFDSVLGGASWLISGLFMILTPLIIGLVIAYIMDPLVAMLDGKLIGKIVGNLDDPAKRLKRQRLSRLISVIVTFIIFLVAIALLLYYFAVMIMGKLVVGSVNDVIDNLMQIISTYEADVKAWVAKLPEGMLGDKLQAFADSFMKWLTDSFSASGVMGTVTSFVGGIANFVIGIIVSIYLLIDKKYFLQLWNKSIKLLFPKKSEGLNGVLRDCDSVLSQFIRGVLLDALIVAILASAGLTISGLQFGVLIGIFAGVCNVIPYFGPILGMIPAFIVGFLTDGFWQGAIAVIILLVIQQVDGSLIYPKVVGSSTGLHPLFVLLAVAIAGMVGGLAWMILAVPIAGIIQLFVKKWADKREHELSLE